MRKLAVAVALTAALTAPAAAAAHPLGNFTVNRFSRVEAAAGHVYVRYVLDLAEIPTYQAGRIDAAAYARRIAARVHLELDGRPVHLTPTATALAHPPGAAGLPTTRLEVLLLGPAVTEETRFAYRDGNFPGRIGWREIVVGDAPSRSRELRAYPRGLLQSPLEQASAAGRLEPAAGPAPSLDRGPVLQAPDRVADGGFTRLVGRGRLGFLVVLASLAAALFWGAAHALSPGHGKAIVTAYLVGQRGTPRHAILLGLVVTATHTIGVFGLGLATLALSQFIVPDRLYPWIDLLSGLLVVGIGAVVLRGRWRHSRSHRHGEEHHHGHAHDHAAAPTSRGLLGVGISAGLLPCPSALVVLLAAISLHRVAFGLLLIVAFSAGLAATISGIGLVAVLARRAFARVSFEGRLVRLLPAASALVIVGAGIAMTLRSLPRVA